MQKNGTATPYLEIVEQPKSKGFRFRYLCEGRSAGSLPGISSTNDHRTFPTVKIHNTGGKDCIIVASCVTKDEPARPHPHSLVGKDCNKGVCTVRLNKTDTTVFSNLGIQCAKRKEVNDALQNRKDIRVDPFQTGFQFDVGSIDLSVVRLCFQAFLPDANGRFTRVVKPIVSNAIYDRKSVSELGICRISKHSGSVRGGDEVFLLCDKVNKDDIEVRLYQEDRDGVIRWEDRGDFGPQDVHRQYAIVFKTPKYHDMNITQPVTVSLQLRRQSDQESSEPIQFQYIPDDRDYDLIASKRKRKKMAINDYASCATPSSDFAAPIPEMDTKMLLQEKLRTKTSATNWNIKQENGTVPFSPTDLTSGMINNYTDISHDQLGILEGAAAMPTTLFPTLNDQPNSDQTLISQLSSGGNMDMIAGLIDDYNQDQDVHFSSGDIQKLEEFLQSDNDKAKPL